MPVCTEILVSVLALVVAVASAFFSYKTAKNADVANELTKEIFRKQNVVDLHLVWRGVNDINPSKLIAADIVAAVNALDFTAASWNHDIVKKEIIIQSYWRVFSQLYKTLDGCDELVPGKKQTCRALLEDSAISAAYDDMKDFVNLQTATSTLGGKENAKATRAAHRGYSDH